MRGFVSTFVDRWFFRPLSCLRQASCVLWTQQRPAVIAGSMARSGKSDRREGDGPTEQAGRSETPAGKSKTQIFPALPTTPHDRLFRALASDPGRAAALIRDHLPERIVGLLAATPPVALDGSYVDEALRVSQSDMLFRVELASGGPAFVYLLAEHKSSADPGTPLQLASYMISYQNFLIVNLIGMFFLSERLGVGS